MERPDKLSQGRHDDRISAPVDTSDCVEDITELAREGIREAGLDGVGVVERRPNLAASISSLHNRLMTSSEIRSIDSNRVNTTLCSRELPVAAITFIQFKWAQPGVSKINCETPPLLFPPHICCRVEAREAGGGLWPFQNRMSCMSWHTASDSQQIFDDLLVIAVSGSSR